MKQSPGIYLASQSPRRAELLRQIGVDFRVLQVAVDESVVAGETAEQHVIRLALEKARAGRAAVADAGSRPVLGADTVVVTDERVLGKPAGRAEALAMLQSLSGRTHRVLSAVALAGSGESSRLSISRVTFRGLSAAECAAYWDTGEPADKAGGYAIQGLAALFIRRLEGSYSGVMGLPLYETAQLLQAAGLRLL